ncbi:hypothetical protein EV183_003819 [Coemansia sp. RSA 2336]|nr:hypothetical protein EV183_003819 [Coemansia sp. RSA 2336]
MTTGSAQRRRPGWALGSATAAVMLQLVAFIALLLFILSSLDPASITSKILSRDDKPAAGSSNHYNATTQSAASAFNVTRALNDLAEISKTPHSLNDVRSIRVRDYLRSAIKQAIEGTQAEFYDPVTNKTAAEFIAKDSLVYWEDSSLVVRMPGTSDQMEALLVQAHYDAVPMSHGAFDDGVGVAVCLELIRSLASHPTRHPVVINIDWGEENGLFGAMLFARFHPWAENVRAYINLEAGGVGGRAMLFRASHPLLLQAYKQAVRRPCASLVGNDAFKLGIVKSDTDYSVYTTKYGIPGLDLAFTSRRTLYHTASDSMEHVTAESVLSMGIAALDTARQISTILPELSRSPQLPERPRSPALAAGPFIAEPGNGIRKVDQQRYHSENTPESVLEDAVFYDVMSWFMVVRSYTAELVLNILTALVGLGAVIAVQYPFKRALPGSADIPEWESMAPTERLVMQLGRGGIVGALLQALLVLVRSYFAGIFGSLLFTGILINLVMPRLAYTHVLLFALLLFSAAILSNTCVLSAWACRSRAAEAQSMVWYAHCLFRSLALLFVVVPLNWMGIGLLYREQLYTWASIGAVLCTALVDSNTGLGTAWRRWESRLATSHRHPVDDNQERLLDSQHLDDTEDQNGHGLATSSKSAIILYAITTVRMVVGLVLPVVFGLDIMLRQLVIFKDHLADGSPPFACIAITSLDIVTFIMFLAPYIVGIVLDIEKHWLIRYISKVVEPCFQLVQWPQRSTVPVFGRSRVPSRSQISLHTNHRRDSNGSESEAYIIEDADEASDSDANERVILLGNNSSSAGAASSNHRAPPENASDHDSDGDGDDGLGRRQLPIQQASKSESSVMLIYMWTGVWLVLWILSQFLMLGGENYTSNPLKVRVFQTTHLSADCANNGANNSCAISKLALASPDSAGLASLLNEAVSSKLTPACYMLNTRGFYKCNYFYHSGDIEDLDDASAWTPETAIKILNISHTTESAGSSTVFNVKLTFSAPETRTCFIDLGGHRGYSPQAYPNPHPSHPPENSTSAAMPSQLFLQPVIPRVVLPIIENARFVDGTTGNKASVFEPVYDRDPVFSGRIFSHKQEFDQDGKFAAHIQYSVPMADATNPAGIKLDISCFFDQAEKHTKLLASIIDTAPKWSVFTPDGNTLSTVTVSGIEI